jgi:hypothetical protein
MADLAVRIFGQHLPGLGFDGRSAVHVGVQRGSEVVDIVPGDAPIAVFDFAVRVVEVEAGELDFRGPYVHGRRGERFMYLSWGELGGDGAFAMFRRAKLHLSAIEQPLVRRALKSGARIEAELSLTDGRGGPVCASVRPPRITWSVHPYVV